MKVTPVTGNRGKRVFPSRCNLLLKEAVANFSCPSVYHHWGNSYKIVINCYDEEKEIAVLEKEFHAIKIGDKILCNVYRSANRVVTVELNEHWKDAGDKYDN